MTNILLGAVFGFATALLLQTVIIQRVQARTRWRERWEADVIEFFNILQLQLRTPRSRLFNAREVETLLEESDPALPNIAELRDQARAETTAADDEVSRVVERLEFLALRLAARYQHDPDFVELLFKVVRLAAALSVAGAGNSHFSAQAKAEWEEAHEAYVDLRNTIKPYALAMKPPPRRRVRRWWPVTRLLARCEWVRKAVSWVASTYLSARRYVTDGPGEKPQLVEAQPAPSAEN